MHGARLPYTALLILTAALEVLLLCPFLGESWLLAILALDTESVNGRLSDIDFSSVQSLSPVQLFVTLWAAEFQASLSITSSWSLLKLMSMELVMPSYNIIVCSPLLLLASIFAIIKVFSNESVHHIKWPKYWSFSFSISPSNEYSGLISFRIHFL